MKPLFEKLCKETLSSAIAICDERGDQYGDTLGNCQWLSARAVAKEVGVSLTREQARAICAAGLHDVKYQRLEGGYKADHYIDGINYSSVVPGCVELAKDSMPDCDFDVTYDTDAIEWKESSYSVYGWVSSVDVLAKDWIASAKYWIAAYGHNNQLRKRSLTGWANLGTYGSVDECKRQAELEEAK